MRRYPVILAALLLTISVAACQKQAPPHAAAADAANDNAMTGPAFDGTPRIADAPGGVHIQYRMYGSGNPVVVLIHGWSCDSNYWAAQIEPLKARYTVMTVDLAGHGGSAANRSDWSINAFADDVIAALTAQQVTGPVVLVGHSMGGPVAVDVARKLGAQALGVIGVDTLRISNAPPPSAAETETRMAPFRANFIGATRDMVSGMFFTPSSDPVLVRRVADDMSQAPPEVALPAMLGLNAWDRIAALSALQVPIVLINAEQPPTALAPLQALAPQLRVVTISGLGHFLMMEDPTRFNPVLLTQIDALTADPT